MRFKSNYLFYLSLIFLILSGASVILNHRGFALHLISLAFGILVAAEIFYIKEVRDHEN